MKHPSPKEELQNPIFWRDLLCEFLITAILLAFHLGSRLTFSDTEIRNALLAGVPMGFLVFALIETFGHISGAHMNPSVTLGFLCLRSISIVRAIFYLIAQCAGGIAGSALIYWIAPPSLRYQVVPIAPHELVTDYKALVVEIFLTMVLMVVVCGATDDKNRSVYMPALPIGCTVGLNIALMGNFSGACMNPAVTFGPAVITGKWTAHWVYWVGPLLGAVLATLIYRYSFILLQDKFGKDAKQNGLSKGKAAEGECEKRLLSKDEELQVIHANGNHDKSEKIEDRVLSI